MFCCLTLLLTVQLANMNAYGLQKVVDSVMIWCKHNHETKYKCFGSDNTLSASNNQLCDNCSQGPTMFTKPTTAGERERAPACLSSLSLPPSLYLFTPLSVCTHLIHWGIHQSVHFHECYRICLLHFFALLSLSTLLFYDEPSQMSEREREPVLRHSIEVFMQK